MAAQAKALLITRTSAPDLYVDTGATPKAMTADYVSYLVTDDDTAVYPDLWVGIGGFSGGNVGLAPKEPGIFHLGSLNPGQSKAAYFYLEGTPTASAQGHTITLYPSKPPVGSLLSQAFTLNSVSNITIQSANNAVNIVTSQPNPPSLGGVILMSVSGHTGTLGSPNVLAFTPASYSDWPANCFQLYSVALTLTAPNAGTFQDTLFVPPPITSTADTYYKVDYYFRTVSATTSAATASPIAYLSSGSQVKHTDTGSWASANLQPILTLNNYLLLSKTASASSVQWPAPVSYQLQANNTGVLDANMDTFVDDLPSTPGAAAYVPGSSTWDGVPIADPIQSGQRLTWSGFFFLPATSVLSLSYQVAFPQAAGSYVNRAFGKVASSQIDRTLDSTDNSPSAWSVSQILPTASPSFTISPTFSASPTQSPTALGSFTETPTFSFSPTLSATLTGTPTRTPTPQRSFTSTATISATYTTAYSPSMSPTRSLTHTRTYTLTATPSPTRTPTRTASPTATITSTVTAPGTFTQTPSWTDSPTVTESFTITPTFSDSPTETPSSTASPSSTDSPTATPSATPSNTSTNTPTATDTPTETHTRTITETFTDSPTPSQTPTISPTFTDTATPTASATVTLTHTPVVNAALARPWPNPLRPLKGELMSLPYQVSTPGRTRLRIYNMAGERVRILLEADLPNGSYNAVWNGKNDSGAVVSSGLYLVLFETTGGVSRSLVGVIK